MTKLFRQVRKIEVEEKTGSHGSWREDFRQKYSAILLRIQRSTHARLLEVLTSTGETISCRDRCCHCCFHYVTISIGHGIVIADYLYKRPATLERFLNNYESWRRTGRSISDRIDRKRTEALSASVPIEDIIRETRSLSTQYFDAHIPCPFLVDDRCSIYEVRPWSCSGHYSTTPPAWCSSSAAQNKAVLYNQIPDDEDLAAVLRTADSRLILHEFALPSMIYRLLTEGSMAVITTVDAPDH